VYEWVYEEVYKMRTNVDLDDDLLNKAFRYSKAKTKKSLIQEALQELIAAREKLDLRELKGKITFREDYDYKKLRRGN
jgi:Arc/MetJ family transcription regulator